MVAWMRGRSRFRSYWSRRSWRDKVLALVTGVATFAVLFHLAHTVWSRRDTAGAWRDDATDDVRLTASVQQQHHSSLSLSLPASTGLPTGDTKESLAASEQRMQARRRSLAHHCGPRGWLDDWGGGGVPPFRTQSLVSRRLHLLYCPVGKTASTFLTRFLVAALETAPVISPYAIPSGKALRMRTKTSGRYRLFEPLPKLAQAGAEEVTFLQSLTKVIFVRCPFERLWSAYVDKIVFPNPYYWQTWGLPAMLSTNSSGMVPGGVRNKTGIETQNPTSATTQHNCGQGATFQQFLTYALSDLYRHDTHVRPISWECSPCYVKYNVIGHVDTLAGDVLYLTALLGLDNATLVGDNGSGAVDWDEEYAREAIADGAESVLGQWVQPLEACMTLEDASRRLWRSLQIRGIISDSESFPAHGRLQPMRSKRFTAAPKAVEAVVKVLAEARVRSRRDPAGLLRQRTAAFLEAYRRVDMSLKERIRQIYHSDFDMFGFDTRDSL